MQKLGAQPTGTPSTSRFHFHLYTRLEAVWRLKGWTLPPTWETPRAPIPGQALSPMRETPSEGSPHLLLTATLLFNMLTKPGFQKTPEGWLNGTK